MARKSSFTSTSQEPRDATPTMAAELPDPSRQRSRSISSLAKRARYEFRSLLDIKTIIAARRDQHVLPDLVGGLLSANDLEATPIKGARQRPREAPLSNEREFRGASFEETYEEQRRGMLSFQDPFVMLGAEDISTPTASLGWLPVDEHKSNPGTAKNISKMLVKIRKFTMRLPDSKTAPECPNQDPYTTTCLRFPTTPRDSPIPCPNDTLRAVNQSSLPIKESRSGTSATTDPQTNGLVSGSELTEVTSSTGFDCETRRDTSLMQLRRSEPSFSATETDSYQTNLSEASISGLDSSTTSMGEETSSSASVTDDNDGASDVTGYTDVSLIENFESSPVHPNVALLSALMSIKDEAVSRIVCRAQLTTPGQGARQHISGNASAQCVSQNPESNSSNNSSHSHLSNARKRLLDNNEQGYDAGDGDDGKERRTREDLPLALLPSQRTQKFACPFFKRYPQSSSLPKSCHGPGWQSVHRVKEHIYRRHQRPMHRCARCLVFFEDERGLIEHTRAEQRCDNQSAPAEEEIIYITQTQERALRKRHRNIPEEDRWALVFQVVFPDIPMDRIPSPYYKLDPGDLAPDVATLDEFRAFVVQELPSRIINDVNNHLRFLPGVTIVDDQMASILCDTIQEVLGEFLHVPGSQGHHQVTGSAMGVSSETNLGELSAFTSGDISSIPMHPLDMSSICHSSWFSDMPSPDPWKNNLATDPAAILSQDPGLQPSFMIVDGLPINSAFGIEYASGGHIRHGATQDGRHIDELFGFPSSPEHL